MRRRKVVSARGTRIVRGAMRTIRQPAPVEQRDLMLRKRRRLSAEAKKTAASRGVDVACSKMLKWQYFLAIPKNSLLLMEAARGKFRKLISRNVKMRADSPSIPHSKSFELRDFLYKYPVIRIKTL
jgi:hypothetical protein